MFFCAISGEPPQEPVVSAKSGKVYERRLILKYIQDNGTDPITGDKLEESDLIAIKATPDTAPPRPPAHSSIPALLHALQNEWDALVLETFALKQQYNSTRQELSHALYSEDAARRVIARLLRERDAARDALANVQANIGVAPTATEDVEMTETAETTTLPAEILSQIEETQQVLSASRKKRKPPAGYATPADVKSFAVKQTISSLHAASPAGINALAVSTLNPSQFVTGGNDKVVQVYDRETDKVLATLKGHTKKVNHVAFREREGDPQLVLSGGADKLAKIWSLDDASQQYIPKSTIRTHKGEITGVCVHPTNTILGLSSSDKTYSLHDLTSFTQIFRSDPLDEPFTAAAIHPDGTLMAMGTPSGSIQIFDLKTCSIVASLAAPQGETFNVNTLSFSENGYILAAPGAESTVALWDLRKRTSTKSLDLGDGFKITKVLYDPSAQYLAVGGSGGGKIFAHKSWEELVSLDEVGAISSLVFGVSGKEIWGTHGREVKIWGTPA